VSSYAPLTRASLAARLTDQSESFFCFWRGKPSTMPSPRFAIVLCFALLGITAPAAERVDDPGEHDFGDAIVVFTLEYEDDLLPAPPWALASARIRRLGNLFFLTGTLPEGPASPDDDAPPARRHWIPLADIVRMAEYEDIETALRSLEIDGGPADGDRPVVRRMATGSSMNGRAPRGK
jgi:hypothetical protein